MYSWFYSVCKQHVLVNSHIRGEELLAIAEDVPVDIATLRCHKPARHEGGTRYLTKVTVGPVLNAGSRAVLAQKFVVVWATVSCPDGLVTSVCVVSHCQVMHERDVAGI